jgi:hypothetical protein
VTVGHLQTSTLAIQKNTTAALLLLLSLRPLSLAPVSMLAKRSFGLHLHFLSSTLLLDQKHLTVNQSRHLIKSVSQTACHR